MYIYNIYIYQEQNKKGKPGFPTPKDDIIAITASPASSTCHRAKGFMVRHRKDQKKHHVRRRGIGGIGAKPGVFGPPNLETCPPLAMF